ncbi:phage tail tip lysozyme [Methylobacterium sp. J-072]|uniref:phage tail tip lysozyme n=1 Tax=Methylobacterium sp. J-072 TaxID=2836651 RepID=UPI001FBB81AA|nr:phage tail tip lysozyme [Methylobacterium sp. J-072]MCJ2092200.1 phage tail tip lysozyme [Methylobacterium sp. J-072]
MADEALRMQAEVQDKFSGPLKALRSQLLDVSRTGANHSDMLAKGFKGVEGAMQSTARTASSVVNPAFAALGVTGLTAGAAVAGISNALNKLTGNLTGLGQLSRETGVAAKTLQEFGAVAGRFGVEQDAVANSAKNFAAQMRTFSRGTGEAFNWVMRQGTDAAGRKAFQDFASDLQHTSDEGEKLKKALSFMETIRNPVERGIFAQQFFGNQDLGRLADGHLGKVVDLFKKAREKLGEFKPEDIIDAEKFDRSVSSLKGSMQRLGTTIAREVLGPATELTTWADNLVSGQRADVTKSLREGLQGVKKELGEINWKQFGEDTVKGLQAGTALAGSLAKTMHEIAEAIHAIRGGEYAQAARGLDGASGPLARAVAPRVGDDEIAAKEEVDLLRRQIDRPMVDFESGASIDTSFLDAGRKKQLEEAEGRLKALQERTPEQRQKDFESSDKLRRSIDSLTDEMKASRSGATVQKQSMDTQGGLFGGATVQSAAFGGGFRRPGGFGGGGYGGGANLPGGGSGPGYGGEQGAAGGGRFNGLGGGRPRIAPMPMPPMGPGGASVARGGLAANQQEAYRAARAEGLSDVAARALVANMSGESLRNPRDHHWDRKHMSQGIVQWDPQRAEAIRRKFGAYPKDMSVTDQTRAAIDEIKSNPRFRRTARALDSDNPNDILGALVENYEAPKNTRRAIAERQQFYRGFVPKSAGATAERADSRDANYFPDGRPRILKPEGMPNAPGVTMAEAQRHRDAMKGQFTRRAEVLADPNDERRQGEKPFYSDEDDRRAARDLGIALRATRAKQDAQREQMRLDGARVGAAAAQAGVVGSQVNGSVTTVIEKAGPEAKARTSVNGNLFQEVRTQNGSQMRKAD